MSEWISVAKEPPEDRAFVDVWYKNERWTDIEYADGVFSNLILDDDGDYSHSIDIEPSHWMYPPEPPEQDK